MDKIALITEEGEKITYTQLDILEKKALSKLSNRRLAFIIVDNNLESVVFYIGCLKKKIVPLLLHNKIPIQQFEEMLSAYLPYYLIIPCNTSFKSLDYMYLDTFGKYDVLFRREEENYFIDNNLALLLSTSGSTGSPKCVKISYDNLKSNTESICRSLQINENDVVITTLPMDYTYGLSIINTHLYQRACIVLNTISIIHKAFWEKIAQYKCTTFGGVPYTYEIIDKLKLINRVEGLRYLTQAGGKLSPLLVEKMANHCSRNKMKFIVMYGQTEATARISYLSWDRIEGHYNSIGTAIPGGELYLINEKKERIYLPYTEGELVYRGKNVTLGYSVSYDDLSKGDERRGILLTGDTAYFDNEGLYYITGRKKRMIKIFGNRVNLDEIEQYLIAKGYSVVCIGSDNKIVIIYVGENFNTTFKETMKKDLVQKGIISSAILVKGIKDVPLKDSGKIDYKKLEMMYL